MLRRLIDWLLYFLHIKDRPYKPVVELLTEVLPIIFAAAVIMAIGGHTPLPQLNWWQRWLYKLRHFVIHQRKVIVGY